MRTPRNLSMRLDFSDCWIFLVKLFESCFCVEMFITGEVIYRIFCWMLSYIVGLKQGRLPKSWILGCH